MLKAIVFDFDGVLVDSEPLHFRAFLGTAQTIGLSFDYEYYVKHLIGYDDSDAFRVLLMGGANDAQPEAFDGDEGQISALKAEKARAFAQIARHDSQPIAGALGFVAGLPPQLPLAISSGATAADIQLLLKGLGLKRSLDPIVSADDVVRSKPDPQSYRLAVEGLIDRNHRLQLKPQHCLAIEDTPAGIASARGAGLKVLALTTSLPAAQLGEADRIESSFVGLNFDLLRSWFDH